MPEGRRRPAKARVSAHEVQAAVEGVEVLDGSQKVSLLGQEFRMAEKVGLVPLMLLAVASKQGVDAGDMRGLVAMYEVIRDCIDESEWDRFQQHAIDTKADADDLMKVVTHVIEVLSARPTRQPGDLSSGQRSTSAKQKASSRQTGTPPDDGMTSVDSLLGL